MSIAVRTNTVLAASITQANLEAAIKTAMANAGFSNLVTNFTNGTERILVYDHIVDGSKTYGKCYLVMAITAALAVRTNLFSDYIVSSSTGVDGGTATTFTAFVSTSNINFTAFNAGTEFKMVVAVQGSVIVPIGVLVPAIRPNWYDLNLWVYGYRPTASNFSTWSGSSRNPYNNDANTFLTVNNGLLATANPQTNRRDLVTGILLANNSNTGITGKTSEDLAIVAASGSSRYDTIQPQGTTQTFTILNNAAGGFAIRTS